MHEFRLISRYYGALHVILGHTPYLPGSYEVCLCVHTVFAKMLSHVLIGWGFITSLIGWHTCHTWAYPLPPGSYGVCLVVRTVLIEMMSHVIFLGFIMFLLDVILPPSYRDHLEFVCLCKQSLLRR